MTLDDCACTVCGWRGDRNELVNDDVREDSDGDMSAGAINACPDCLGPTVDLDDSGY